MMGRYRYFAGTLTIGTMVAFYTYITRIFDPIATAMELYSRSQRMMVCARRVLEVMNTEPSVPDSGDAQAIAGTLKWSLSLEAVSLRHGPNSLALREVTLHIEGGETVAIVGCSGSGKSTLARLCVRMINPTSGIVSLNGRPVSDYTLLSLRDVICYVPQRPSLFRGSIRENLLYANHAAKTRELEQVIEAAQLEWLLRRFPHGLDHELDSDATGLSGGEQQRLAVARALLRKSSILILDESTSALDIPTEAALLRAVRQFRDGHTTILISHRLQSLSWVKRFIVLEHGEIVGEGNHSKLYRESRLYRTLLDAETVSATLTPGVEVGVSHAAGNRND